MRIVSLLPSATEIVCALGLADHLVGVSHDCDYPAALEEKRVLSDALVSPAMPSPQIDAAIRGHVHSGKSVYHLDGDLLAALRPDLILTQELCRVCAPSFTDVRTAARVLEGRTRIVSLEPHGVEDVLETILEVGRLTGADAAAGDVVAGFRARIDRVQAMPAPMPRPRVVCLEWLDPLFVAGHWVPEMVEMAGGVDVFGRARRDSYVVEWGQMTGAAPDVIVVMPCGFDIARTRDEIHLLTRRPGWADIPAVRHGRVYLTDGSAFFSRPGPRIVRGLEILAEAFRATASPLRAEGIESL